MGLILDNQQGFHQELNYNCYKLPNCPINLVIKLVDTKVYHF